MPRNWQRDCKNYRAMYLEAREEIAEKDAEIERLRKSVRYWQAYPVQQQMLRAMQNAQYPFGAQQLQAQPGDPLFRGVFGGILG